jgi:thiamine-phosphate pyrophosphorylase
MGWFAREPEIIPIEPDLGNASEGRISTAKCRLLFLEAFFHPRTRDPPEGEPAVDRQIMRIIDANLNRLTEGLRVVEDVFRYALDDAGLQQRLKSMRHRIASSVDTAPFIASRDAARDVGMHAQGLLENRRGSLGDIVRSNLKRVQEACRVLEEVFKLENPGASTLMKELRYESYQVERDLALREKRTPPRGLFLNLNPPWEECLRQAVWAVHAQVPAVVLSHPGPDARAFLDLARSVREVTGGSATRLIVSDRVDVAVAAGADGMLLAACSLAPAEARLVAGESIILGMCARTLEEVEDAGGKPIDYIAFGPVFPPLAGETAGEPVGIETLREAAGRSRLPVVASGGIDEKRVQALAGIPLLGVSAAGGARDLGGLLRSIGELS